MPYKLSDRSKSVLRGVHHHLAAVVETAIELTDVDFTVGEGRRTLERQKQLLAQGKTKTLDSRHLTGHAVDLYALKDGVVNWDIELYYGIAEAMREASKRLGVPVVSGLFWGQLDTTADLRIAVSNYRRRKLAEHGKPLIDGPHFELPRIRYPAETKHHDA